MNNQRNENGAALVITLLIITLLLLFVLTLFNQVTNTTKQVTTMEKQMDARLVAEMGIDYYHSLTEKIVREESITEPDKIESRLDELDEKKELDPNHKFILSNIVVVTKEYKTRDARTRIRDWETYDDDHDDEDDDNDGPKPGKITITFTSTGIAHEKEVTIEDNNITINFESN